MSKGVKLGEDLYVEFDEKDNVFGPHSHNYGKHIGTCVARLDITQQYEKMSEVVKNQLWEQTKVKVFLIG